MNSKEFAGVRGRSQAWVSDQIKAGMPAAKGGRSGKDYEIDPVAAMRWELERKATDADGIGPMPECLERFGGNLLRLINWELCKTLAYVGPQCLAIAADTDGWGDQYGLSDAQVGALMSKIWMVNAQVLQHFLGRKHDGWFRDAFGYDIDDAADRIWPDHSVTRAPMPAAAFMDEIGEMPPAVKKLFTETAQALVMKAASKAAAGAP